MGSRRTNHQKNKNNQHNPTIWLKKHSNAKKTT